MNLEEKITQSLAKYLKSQELEQKIDQAVTHSVDEVIDNMFNSYNAPGKEIIENQLKEGILPELKQYDYSDAVIKMQDILNGVMKQATAENNQTLRTFAQWATTDTPANIKLSKIFKKYADFVANYVDTSNLNVEIDDDQPHYEEPDISLETQFSDTARRITLSCDQDSSLIFEFGIFTYHDENTIMVYHKNESLTMINEFEAFLRNLEAHKSKIEPDVTTLNDSVEVVDEPEADFY